ncbi:MAG TPA: transketolase [Actinomycetota bacterium]|nr:transketolase [Actinomycetota bacterium]
MTTATDDLEKTARRIRRHIVEATTAAASGHPSSSLSGVEVATTLFFGNVLKYDAKNPKDPDRDRFILSKGHAAPLLYALLAEAGYIDVADLPSLRKFGSPLEGHPNYKRVPGVEASTGSLGQGLSQGIGHALAARLDGKAFRVYVMQGDGETQEGQVWEALMFAGFHNLDNLTLIIDSNRFQQTGAVDEILPLDPLPEKLTSFGWEVIEIDGHSLSEAAKAFAWAKGISGSPQAIIANTKKGRGVKYLEEQGNFHGKPLSRDDLVQALVDIEAGLE